MATRQNTVLLKRSNVIGKIPPLSGLTLGEMALNTADAKLYSLYTSGTTGATEVRQIGWDRISRTGDTVTGDFNFFGDISISGSVLPNGYALTVTGDTDIVGDLYVEGNIDYDGNLIVSGSGVFQSGLTANTIYTDYIDFNTGATVPQSVGRVSWDTGTGTLNIAVGDAGTGLIDLQVGQEEIVRVYNSEATTLAKGEIVYVSGSQGNRPAVKRAVATSDGYSVTTLGMVDRNITSGSEGYVTTFGVISNLNTLGLTGGTPIWLSGTVPGGYTSTKPIAPLHTVLIGYVVRVSATVGSIFVNISNGWELDEIHDVRISGVTEGDLLMRSSYSGTPVWVNTKTLNGSYTITGNTNIGGNLTVSGTTYLQGLSATTISATTIGVSGDCIDDIYVSNIHSCSPLNINPLDEGNVYFGSTSAVTIDLSNNRVGIGTTTPTAKLHINNTTSGNTFLAEDSTNPDSSPFVIDASGNTGIGTTTPTAKLSISGNTHLSGETRYYISNVLYDGFIRPASSLSGLILELGSSSSGTHIQILPSNRTFFYQSTYFTTTPTINFGVSIGDRLTINNGIYTGSTNTLIWAGNNANSNIFKIQGDSKIAINKSTALAALDISGDTLVSGNVGIGTLTPREKLDVSGNTIISSGLTATTINVPPLADDKIVYTTNNGRLTTTSAFTYNQSNNTFSVNNIDANGNFNITGNTTQSGSTTQIGNFTITGNTIQSGNTFQNGDINITGDTNQIGNVTLSGNTFITGNTVIDGSLSADTVTITNTPTLNNTLFQILGRNETTGDVEYRQVNTIGNNVTILTGGTYSAQTTIDNVIGVDTTLTTTTIYLPDSVSSGRLRFEIKDIGLNAYNNPITIIAAGTDTIISYTNSQTLIMESEGGAIILLNTGLGQWWQM